MAIPESFIEQLVERADIYEIVSKYVTLKKNGGNFFGLCPFHGEKTPSFSVAPDKQIFHCFGCGAGGGVISFIMKMENFSFVEAVHHLAEIYNMQVPEEGGADEYREQKARLLELSRQSAKFFHTVLLSPEGKEAKEYLLNRGLSMRTITNFGLGYAPNTWDSLITQMTKQGFTKKELTDAGLVSNNKSGGIFDRFRGRVMFPIIDTRGNVIAFGGRVMDDSLPKYINSSDTPIYNKSRNLFAINIAKKTNRKNFILAEGYMDVIALHQAGFDNAVASLGTALTNDQAKLISRFTKEVVICYDTDAAGQKAVARAMDIFSKSDISVRVLKLSGAKDPDEYIKKNSAEAFEDILVKPQTDTEFKLSTIHSKYDLSENDQKIAFLKEATRMVAGLKNEVERELFSMQIAQKIDVSPQAVINEVKKEVSAGWKKEKKELSKIALNPTKSAQPKDRDLKYENIKSAMCEERIIALILSHNELIGTALSEIEPHMFSSEFLSTIFDEIKRRHTGGESVLQQHIINHLSVEKAAHLSRICTEYVKSNNVKKELFDYISVIKSEFEKKNQTSDDDLLSYAAKKKKGSGENG